MKVIFSVAAVLVLAAPASAQTVSAGIAQWQKGDPAAAVATWTPLAARGDADAAFNLGQAYRLGKGAPVNLPRAQEYLEQAARKGHVDAATTLGLLMFQGGNRVAAMRWLRQAADGGEPRAMLLYGTALYNGDGVARDPVRAYAFVSRAAAQGLPAARETLADLDGSLSLDERQKGVALAKSMLVSRPAASVPKPAGKAIIAAPVAAVPVTAAPVAATKSAPTRIAQTPAAPLAGNWRIQLGAFGQRATAEALFARMRRKVGARQSFIVPAGNVVRLQVGPYESRAAAAAACASLGGACFPVSSR